MADIIEISNGENGLSVRNKLNELISRSNNLTPATIDGFDAAVSSNTDVAASTAHISSDGSDHSDVVLNSAYRVVGHIPLSQKAASNGVATLDSGGKIPTNQLPTATMTYKGVWNASTNTPTLADGSGATGDYYIVGTGATRNLGSGNITFVLGDSVIYNGTIWQKSGNANAVSSVNGFTGIVVLDTDDIPSGTTTRQLTATDQDAYDAAHLHSLSVVANNPHGYKTYIDNADSLKAPIASPTFTGTVSGITKSMVGLGNVDNTSDANKPVSTAQQTALNLKSNIASPTFTGTVTAPTLNVSGATASRVAGIDASKNITGLDTTTYPSLTELSYVKGVTSGIQAQIGTKAALVTTPTAIQQLELQKINSSGQYEGSGVYKISSVTEFGEFLENAPTNAQAILITSITLPSNLTINGSKKIIGESSRLSVSGTVTVTAETSAILIIESTLVGTSGTPRILRSGSNNLDLYINKLESQVTGNVFTIEKESGASGLLGVKISNDYTYLTEILTTRLTIDFFIKHKYASWRKSYGRTSVIGEMDETGDFRIKVLFNFNGVAGTESNINLFPIFTRGFVVISDILGSIEYFTSGVNITTYNLQNYLVSIDGATYYDYSDTIESSVVINHGSAKRFLISGNENTVPTTSYYNNIYRENYPSVSLINLDVTYNNGATGNKNALYITGKVIGFEI